jgi:pyruvate/2-oxoglutarate dehydrogenase complex dihydrolipoamide dehydrogenase (E3) component
LKPGGLFAKYGIEVITGAEVSEITNGEVITTGQSGEKKPIKADTIINAMGRQKVVPEKLVSEARELGKKIFVIGDAKAPRETRDAIREGFMTAVNI